MIRGGAVREPPLRFVNNEGVSSMGQSIFMAITGEGAHEGRPYGGWDDGEGMGPCMREDNGGGMGSVWEAPSAVGSVEGTCRHYCQTVSRMPMTAYEIRG